MLTTLLMAFTTVTMAANTGIVPVKTMDPVSEESDYFLRMPMDVTFDQEGRLYVSDAQAKTVFVWNADGTYLTNFGQEGEGPGEFRFMGMGGPQAYLGVLNENILVYDGASRAVNVFTKDLEFVNSKVFTLPNGRTNYFQVTPKGDYLVYYQQWGGDAKRTVALYDKDAKLINNITQIEDKTYTTKQKDGRFAGITLHAFSPNLIVHFDREQNVVITGDSGKPSFEIYNLDGTLKKKVKFAMSQPEVTQADRDEYNEQPWIKNSNWVSADFPDKKAFYTHIRPVKGKGFLVYERSPHYGNIKGMLVDGEGKTLGRIAFTAGEGGDLYSVDGRIIAIRLDDYGDFIIEEMGFGKVGS